MSVSRVIEVSFGGGSIAYAKVDTAYFYNNGIIFKPTDIDLPASYQVHWADSPDKATTLETIGTAEGAPIPDDLWNRSRVIYGWIYLHPTENSAVTAYEVRIYKNVRAGLPDGTEPTPAEQSTIDQLISAMNSAVEQTGEDVESASQSAQSAESAKTAAESARDTAGEYANDAESSAASASTSASQASTSATASAQSASQSAQIKADVEGMVDDAQGYASASAQSASASANSASDAQGYANSASASAQSASGYASSAQTSAQTASAKASEASTSASTASQKATEASQSASQALSYKTDAESAKTASQTAQGLAESARDTAVSAKDDAESARDDAETARDEAQSAVASISGALADKAPIITDTASGAIASFSDGADDLPLKSLVVDINPVQDLHGYDSPWPAGGGKNLLPCILESGSQNGFTWTVGSDGVIVISGSSSSGVVEKVIGSLTLESGTYRMNGGTYPSNDIRMQLKLVSGGSSIAMSYNNNDVAFTVEETTSYTVSMVIAPTTTSGTTTIKPMIRLASVTDATFAPYENICPISGWTEVNVNHSDADMTNPTTLTIQLGQTVYGGHLDVLSGELTVDRAIVDLGTLNWNYNSNISLFYALLNPEPANISLSVVANAMCTKYPIVAHQTIADKQASIAYAYQNGVNIKDSAYTDKNMFKAAMSGTSLVYEVATPITYQLTPTEIRSLLGQNNVFADTGDSTVEYRADTKLFIERLTAPDSADMIADANITSGQYFMVGNSLYKATANIANGAQIVVGTNCTRKSLSEALNEINA